MNSEIHVNLQKRGAALIIVLAVLVLLSGLVVAYLSRTTTDRQLAHGTFSENRADMLARSALDVVVADLRQEINAGSTSTTVNGYSVYVPTTSANMVPMRAGTPSPTPTPCANMIRRSVYPELIVSPGVSSRASAVNSTASSLNNRSITKARWNKHYLIPRVSPTPSADSDTTPMTTFTAPDWVLVTRGGPSSFSSWNPAVKDSTATNTSYVLGRYAYAIYDEGGLLDVNVAGFPHVTPTPASTPPVRPQPVYAPSPAYAQGSYPTGYNATTYTAQQIGRKGSSALADLSVLPAAATTYFPAAQINKLVGWRNYATIQDSGGLTSIFNFDSAGVTRYLSYARSVSSDFLNVPSTTFNTATDQRFTGRQELLAFNQQTGFSVGLLQYLGTFSREFNRASWKPAVVTAINPDLSTIRVTSPFNRIDIRRLFKANRS